MKLYIYKILIIMGIMLEFQEKIYAYITVASTSYSLDVGVDQYLSVPNAYYGYIDHAVWTCSNSAIAFKEKDAAGAIIQITRAFSGTAIVELLATEKYLDSFGYTRAQTYYKQYLITCIGGGGGSSSGNSEIIFPENISLNVGEMKRFKVFKDDGGSYLTYWKRYSTESFVCLSGGINAAYLEITGVMQGEGVLTISSSTGDEKDCNITVSSVDIVTNRRTEKVAVSDIKSLIANILPIAKSSGIENVLIESESNNNDSKPNHIYNFQGVLIKRNATSEDIRLLTPGLYIIRGKKVIVR